MKTIRTFILLSAAIAMVACNKNDIRETSKEYGTLQMDMSLTDMTRSMTNEQLEATAVVNIYKSNFDGLVRSYKYSEIPSPFYLIEDSYRVDVLAGEAVAETPEVASWDSKSYKGTETFEIISNQVNSVQVTAYVNNAVTAITLDQTIAENFNAGYTFTIGLDEEDQTTQLVYDAAKSGAEGYFIVAGLIEPSLKWTFNGTLAKDGSAFTKSGVITGVEAGKLYKMNLKYTIKDGDLSFTLMVDYTTDEYDDTIVFEPVSTGLSSSSPFEIWAKRATVHADVDPAESENATVQFSYSANGTDWETVNGVNDSEGTWKADLTGLTPSTTYEYKLMIDGVEIGSSRTFTTEAAPQLPNGSFEYTSKVSGKDFYKFYDPNCGVEEGTYMFWGSGNGEGSEGVEGSGNMGVIITLVDTEDKKHGKQSVLAKTSQMAGILAAGNLFTGQFAGLVGTSGGKVNFGRPWESRPTALRVWCKYSTDKIDIINGLPSGLELTKDDYDRAEIKFAIGDWNYKDYGGTSQSPVHINTTEPSTFVDYTTDDSTIGYGNLIIHTDGYILNGAEKVSAATSGWIQYTIPLDYYNEFAYPTHIIVSFASSQYGDYFTGSSKSKLWIDMAELIYE